VKGGGVLFVGFEGPRLRRDERQALLRLQPAGITLVPRNIEDEAGLVALLAELRALCPEAIFALDAEGGRVDRLRRIAGPAPAAEELAARPPRLAGRAGRWVGASLRHFGFDLDFAPVVDLDRGRRGNALDGRTLGRTPRAVVARARAFLAGLGASGAGCCLKHFPGLGGAGEDTHLEPTRIELGRRELARDLAPFVALLPAADAVMVGHAVYPAIDPAALPATLSPAVCHELLRRRLRYRGALLSDDLEMGALGTVGSLPEIGEAALVAGCDGLLFCRRVTEATAVATRLGRPRLAARRRQAEARLARLRRRLERARRAAPAPPALDRVRARLAAVTAAARS